MTGEERPNLRPRLNKAIRRLKSIENAVANAYHNVLWDGRYYMLTPKEWLDILDAAGVPVAAADLKLEQDS